MPPNKLASSVMCFLAAVKGDVTTTQVGCCRKWHVISYAQGRQGGGGMGREGVGRRVEQVSNGGGLVAP